MTPAHPSVDAARTSRDQVPATATANNRNDGPFTAVHFAASQPTPDPEKRPLDSTPLFRHADIGRSQIWAVSLAIE
jgi:hypothetical protein